MLISLGRKNGLMWRQQHIFKWSEGFIYLDEATVRFILMEWRLQNDGYMYLHEVTVKFIYTFDGDGYTYVDAVTLTIV